MFLLSIEFYMDSSPHRCFEDAVLLSSRLCCFTWEIGCHPQLCSLCAVPFSPLAALKFFSLLLILSHLIAMLLHFCSCFWCLGLWVYSLTKFGKILTSQKIHILPPHSSPLGTAVVRHLKFSHSSLMLFIFNLFVFVSFNPFISWFPWSCLQVCQSFLLQCLICH